MAVYTFGLARPGALLPRWMVEMPNTKTMRLSIPNLGETEGVLYGEPRRDGLLFILAHGAGAGQRHPFLTALASALVERQVPVLTFNFLYLDQRRRTPDAPAVLEATWRAVIAHAQDAGFGGSRRVVVGGKSMGGRIASQVLASLTPTSTPRVTDIAGLVLLGYPLHPPGQPQRPRIAHLPTLTTPTLVVQGARDTFGTDTEVRAAFAAAPATVDWLVIPGGDHSFKVGKNAGASQSDVTARIHDAVATWILGRDT
jgi:uncharacterized protein